MKHSVADVTALYDFYEKRAKTAPVEQQSLIASMLFGLDDVMFRIALNVFDENNIYVSGLSSALPSADHRTVAAIAAKHDIGKEVEVTEAENNHIQDAVIVGEILVKNDIIEKPSIATLLEENTFNLLKKKLQKGRVKDTMQVVDTYRYEMRDLLATGSTSMVDILQRIEEETGIKAFNSIRNTVTQIAITQKRGVNKTSKFPGFLNAMRYVENAIPGFNLDDARRFVEQSVKEYAPSVSERINAKQEERSAKRDKYVEKGYPTK